MDDFWTEDEAAAGGPPPKSKLFQEVYTTKNRMVRIYKVCGVACAPRCAHAKRSRLKYWAGPFFKIKNKHFFFIADILC